MISYVIDRTVRKVIVVSIILFFLTSSFEAFVGETSAEVDSVSVEISKKTAQWIISQAEAEGGGFKWKI
jgi:hypothetical protein